jgi:hypothetical protein
MMKGSSMIEIDGLTKRNGDRVQAVVLAYESGLVTPGTPPPEELS